MAITIVPGYDFGVNEIPTRLLLERQAKDLQITGIPAANIDGTITAIVYGDTSGVSGGQPTAVGWIWVDPGGHRNIGISPSGDSQPRVNARMWSSQGGWETSRLLTEGGTPQSAIPDGLHMWASGAPYTVSDQRLDMDSSFTTYGMTQVFTASPATNTRLLGRGLGVAAVGAQVTESRLRTRRPGILTDAPAQATWRVLEQFSSPKPDYSGTVVGRSHGTTGNSLAGVEVAVWYATKTRGTT